MEEDLDISPEEKRALLDDWGSDYFVNVVKLHARLVDTGVFDKDDLLGSLNRTPAY